MVESAISQGDVSSVNINSTTGAHGANSNHTKGKAVDINRVDGAPVKGGNAGAGRIQDAASKSGNIRENFGPGRMEKTNTAGGKSHQVTDRKLVNGHKDHVHLSGQR